MLLFSYLSEDEYHSILGGEEIMRKNLTLLTAASIFVLGSASMASAAANPFSDVPKDHWAYDAVSQLAADGVLEGYGDATFKGDRSITRYEMAQMTAKAMAKKNVSTADKSAIDKLSAEFADELNNLGVRVSKLERNADNVKWSGVFCNKAMRSITDSNTWWEKELFLNADAQVNESWKVHAGIDTKWGTNTDGWNGEASFSDRYAGYKGTDTEVSSMLYQFYAQGSLAKNLNLTVGLLTPTLQNGYVGNARVKGGELDYTTGKAAIKVYGGRTHEKLGDMSSTWSGTFLRGDGIGDYAANDSDRQLTAFGSAVEYKFNNKTSAGIGFYQLRNSYAYDNGDGDLNIWAVNAKQTLAPNLDLTGFYSHGSRGFQSKAYEIKLTYNGSPWGSKPWGTALGYRYLGSDALITSSVTQGAEKPGAKGIEAELWFHLAKNIQLQNYLLFNSKPIDSSFNGCQRETSFFSNLIFAF